MRSITRGSLVAIALLGLPACADKQCDPQPLQAAWQPYESLLPDNVTICGSTRLHEGQTIDKPSDTLVYVYYNDRDNVAAAFEDTVARFEAAGWKLDDMGMVGEGKHALFDAELSKDGVEVHIGVNNNDFGMQGSFSLTLPR